MRRQAINYTQAQRTFPGLPLPVSSTASVRANEDNESRVLHHHGGAVFFVARRQRAAGRGNSDAARSRLASMDDARAQAMFRHLLRVAGTVGRRVRGFDAKE